MSYLETLRRIPDDIILAIAAHDFDENYPDQCVCGWALREAIGRVLCIDPASDEASDRVEPDAEGYESSQKSYDGCQTMFGGSNEEWRRLYHGAMDETPLVEEAFVDRLNEIVGTV